MPTEVWLGVYGKGGGAVYKFAIGIDNTLA